MMYFDTLCMELRIYWLRQDSACPACGDNPTITELVDYEEFCGLRQAPPEQSRILQVAAGR